LPKSSEGLFLRRANKSTYYLKKEVLEKLLFRTRRCEI
jgi:hypothetical protein